MISLLRQVLDRGLEINERLAAAAANGFDWLFRHEYLVKSGQTEFELVHVGDPMTVRHYTLDGEHAIELADGTVLPIRRRRHAALRADLVGRQRNRLEDAALQLDPGAQYEPVGHVLDRP